MSDFCIPWTVACQASASMGFSRQEYWGGLPFPSPGDLPDPRIELTSLALARRFFTTWPYKNKPMAIFLWKTFPLSNFTSNNSLVSILNPSLSFLILYTFSKWSYSHNEFQCIFSSVLLQHEFCSWVTPACFTVGIWSEQFNST